MTILNREANNADRFPSRAPRSSNSKSEEPDFDWKNLRIDTEKQSYYQGMIERRSRTAPARVSNSRMNGSQSSRQIRTSLNTSQNGKPKDANTGTTKSVKLDVNDFGDAKMMEQALQITKSEKNANSTRSFLKSREKCYEQRFRLTNLLAEDLIRMDDDRKDKFKRKFKSLTVDVWFRC